MGNAFVTDGARPESLAANQGLNLESLKGKFDTDRCISPYSDIVALMVFEHQMHMVNLFTRVGWEVRFALYQERTDKAPRRHSITAGLLRDTARELVDYMLFVDEAPLVNKIQGNSGFAERFSAEGPRDSRGRSLRRFDLQRRLMRYPCSYMIYSEAFDGMPDEAEKRPTSGCGRFFQAKSRATGTSNFLSLTVKPSSKSCETKKGLPGYFQPVAR